MMQQASEPATTPRLDCTDYSAENVGAIPLKSSADVDIYCYRLATDRRHLSSLLRGEESPRRKRLERISVHEQQARHCISRRNPPGIRIGPQRASDVSSLLLPGQFRQDLEAPPSTSFTTPRGWHSYQDGKSCCPPALLGRVVTALSLEVHSCSSNTILVAIVDQTTLDQSCQTQVYVLGRGMLFFLLLCQSRYRFLCFLELGSGSFLA